MTEPFVAPSQSIYWTDAKSGMPCHMSIGGPTLYLIANFKKVPFEMHRVFGPIPLKGNGDPRQNIPRGFWDAYERWDLGGKLVDGQTCVVPAWCRMCGGAGYIEGEKRRVQRRLCSEALTCPVCGGKKIETTQPSEAK